MEILQNTFCWIQWIITKSKSGIVAKDILCMTKDTFRNEVVKRKWLLLPDSMCLFIMLSGNRNLPKGSKQSVLSVTTAGNVSAVT